MPLSSTFSNQAGANFCFTVVMMFDAIVLSEFSPDNGELGLFSGSKRVCVKGPWDCISISGIAFRVLIRSRRTTGDVPDVVPGMFSGIVSGIVFTMVCFESTVIHRITKSSLMPTCNIWLLVGLLLRFFAGVLSMWNTQYAFQQQRVVYGPNSVWWCPNARVSGAYCFGWFISGPAVLQFDLVKQRVSIRVNRLKRYDSGPNRTPFVRRPESELRFPARFVFLLIGSLRAHKLNNSLRQE